MMGFYRVNDRTEKSAVIQDESLMLTITFLFIIITF